MEIKPKHPAPCSASRPLPQGPEDLRGEPLSTDGCGRCVYVLTAGVWPLTLRSLSFPPAEWMASIRALCSDVSFGAGLWTTGRNFFFGPKMLDGSVPSVSGMSVHNKLGFSSCSGGSCWVWLFVLDPLGEQGGSAWMGTHREPFTRVLPGV